MKNNLDTLRVLYIVKGILTLLVSFFPLIYVGIGIVFGDKMNHPTHGQAPPFDVSLLMIGLGSFFFLLIVLLGTLSLVAAKFIGEKKNYNFVFVVAVMTCLGGMLSIALGVFSIIELMKPDVKAVFEKDSPDLIEGRY